MTRKDYVRMVAPNVSSLWQVAIVLEEPYARGETDRDEYEGVGGA